MTRLLTFGVPTLALGGLMIAREGAAALTFTLVVLALVAAILAPFVGPSEAGRTHKEER